MAELSCLKGLSVLIVDDDMGVSDTLEELLNMCKISRATSFEEASDLLRRNYFDIAILDIMGVNGFQILDIANEKRVRAVMLTAHAFSLETTIKSYKRGAAFFVPKEEMHALPVYINGILEEGEKGENTWNNWMNWLGSFYEKKFDPSWKDQDREFWEVLSKKNWKLAAELRKEERLDL